MNRRGFTIAELLGALAVGLVAVSLALETFHLLCHPDSIEVRNEPRPF